MRYVVIILAVIFAVLAWIAYDETKEPFHAPTLDRGYTVLDSDRVINSNGDTVLYNHKKNWQPIFKSGRR
jgi:hypothetical protein